MKVSALREMLKEALRDLDNVTDDTIFPILNGELLSDLGIHIMLTPQGEPSVQIDYLIK